jgi:succinate dehydrogenase / fumarate reductase cytochrome b subunit
MAQALGSPRGPVTGTALARSSRRRKPFLVDLYGTAVGKKYAMALSGIAMMGFVLAHMIGNLKMYQGPADMNGYGAFLKRLLYPLAPKNAVLWLMRSGLILALLVHLHASWSLTQMNRKARSVKYQSSRDYEMANFASRSMRWTGIVVLVFLVWHLGDFTFGFTNTVGTSGEFVQADIYTNLVRSFERVPVALFYVVANILLGIHLFHGAWSIFQSLGWNNPRFNAWRRAFAVGFSTLIVVGNVSFPIAVLAGVVSV